MQDRENNELPEQSALTDENTVSAQEITVATRRKSVGINCGADPGRLEAAVYLGRRWLSLR